MVLFFFFFLKKGSSNPSAYYISFSKYGVLQFCISLTSIGRIGEYFCLNRSKDY